jgi:putative tryptophan/tyrosine transport system substrate-binding protein
MRRREFVALLGCGALVSPFAVSAQPSVRRVGVLFSFAPGDPQQQPNQLAFVQGLQDRGWRQGHNLEIVFRFGAGDPSRMQAYASDLVDERSDVLFGNGTAVARALQQRTRSIPIVFVHVSEPVSGGIVTNLARPGGNITGFTNFEFSMGSKWLEFLKQIAPEVRRIALIFNSNTAPGVGGTHYLRSIEAAAPSFTVTLLTHPVNSTTEIEAAFASLGREPGGGFVVIPEAFTTTHRELIVMLAAHHRLPGIYPFRFFTSGGGLLSYGVDSADLFRRAASYIDRILRGEKPGDLPIESPSKFELVINLKTAKALSLTIPNALLARADEVIE